MGILFIVDFIFGVKIFGVPYISSNGHFPGLRIRAKIFGFPDRRPTRDKNFMCFPTEIRADRKLPENPKAARKPESGRIRAIFRARKSEISESFRA